MLFPPPLSYFERNSDNTDAMPRKRQRPDSPPADDSGEEGEITTRTAAAAASAAARTERKARRKLTKQKKRQAAKAASGAPGDDGDSDNSDSDAAAAADPEEAQRKYFVPYHMPSMSREEDRAMFDMRTLDLRVVPTAPAAAPLAADARLCLVCAAPGHAAPACPALHVRHPPSAPAPR